LWGTGLREAYDRCFHTKITSYRHPQQTVDQQKPEQGPERPVTLGDLTLACHKSLAKGGNCYCHDDACCEDMPICEQPAQIVSLRVIRRTTGNQLGDRAPFPRSQLSGRRLQRRSEGR
jgi:hypothetical protein